VFKLKLQKNMIVKASLDSVFASLTDPVNRLEYDQDLKAVKLTPEGLLNLGTLITETRAAMGQENQVVTEVVALEPRGPMKLIVPRISGKMKRDTARAFENMKALLEKNH
jgi:hypothetical protein